MPFWIYSLLVFYTAVLPAKDIPHLFANINDKLLHTGEYAFLFVCAFNAFRKAKTSLFQNYCYGLSFGYCLAMGVLTEYSQRFVRTRSAEVLDLFADAVGAGLAMFVVLLIRRYRLRLKIA